MGNFRLDKNDRSKIASRVLANRFDKKDTELHDRYAKLAEHCYERQYPKKVRDLMASLPDGWLRTSNDIHVQFGSAGMYYTRLSFNGAFPGDYGCSRIAGRPAVEKMFPSLDRDTLRLLLDNDDPLSVKFHALQAEREEYAKERNIISNEVRGVIGSFHTTGTLLKAWPELEQFMKDIAPIARASTTAIAPIVTDLNKKLGIKPMKVAA